LRAVVGPSYGGFQAFQWAVTFPDDMDAIVPVVSSPRAQSRDRVATLLARFEPEPNWHGGDYYDTPGMGAAMLALRVETLKRYGMNASETEIERIASVWANEFDANSLLILGRAMESYDVTPELHRIRVPVLYVLSRTDELFPPSLAPGVMGDLREAGVTASYFEIDSELGHLASGADAAKWAPALREFMARL
jgi:homoserine O-acetyltransferase